MRRAWIGLSLSLFSAIEVFAQAPRQYTDVHPVPDTPALRRAQQVLEAINTGDPARVKALVESAFAPGLRDAAPMAERLEAFARWRDLNQKLEPYGARTYDPPDAPTKAVLVVRSRLLETWQAVVVTVDPQPPNLISEVDLNPARPPSDLPKGARLEPAQIARTLGDYVDRLAAAGIFSGTVLIRKDDKVLLTRAAGVANRDFNAPVRLDTKFNLGSMNKMLTGVSAMILVRQGKLSLDDPIGKYLDATWLPKVDKNKVLVKHLLTHTSGLGSYFNDVFDRSSRLLYRTVNDYKPLVADETLAFEPGTKWAYSNTGMLIAGAVIEKASGTDYFEFVRRNITGPAGMKNTDCYELDKVNANLAVGYERLVTPAGVDYRNNIFDHVLRGGPAGGGYSTVEDLDRFAQAMRGTAILEAASKQELWKSRPEIASPDYGLGFGLDATRAGRRVGHSGGFTGISAGLDIYLDEGWNVAVLSNLGGVAPIVTTKAAELIFQGR
ncbi:MAG TPA: serine hydrolase domain-containing protein [Candidatus Polarisedimenticolia bacterium]|nr:serine hydrolase domain-containing protein [Candidatus Polarisedimenticolia bacterium]